MTDIQVIHALALIHANPSRHWTVASVAKNIGASRFAARFQTFAGQGLLGCLTHWRMHQAAGQMIESNLIAETAERAAYQSEVAFSKAFKH